MKTFRLRIAVLCAVLAGAVLVAFAAGAWWIAAGERTREFDVRITELARRLLRRVPQDMPQEALPDDFEERMEAALRDEGADARVVLMAHRGQRVLWSSHGEAMEGLDLAAKLPGPDELDRLRPPLGQPFAGPGGPGQPGSPQGQNRPGNPPPLRNGPNQPQRPDNSGGVPQRIPPPLIQGEEVRPASSLPDPDRIARQRQRQQQGQRPPLIFDLPRARPPFDAVVAGVPLRFGSASHYRFTLFAALPKAPLAAQMRSDALLLGGATAGGLLLVGAGAWWVSRRVTGSLRSVVETAHGLNASALDRRIPLAGNEDREIRELITVLNSMMDRLQASFGQAVRFTADASHELQTPLAVMQATLDDALRHSSAEDASTEMLQSLARETGRLKSITRSLLVLSRADAGRLETDREEFSLTDELAALAEDAEILCQEADLAFSADLTPDLRVKADRSMLRQVFQNLLTNAIRYNEPGGRVLLRLRLHPASAQRAEVRLFNTGPGISPEDQPRVFDRFFRGDKARQPASNGLGLGLNIAQEMARANDAELRLEHSGTAGTEFVLTIPAL